jgi:aminoglycoside/choline kinase family phosphotransferase
MSRVGGDLDARIAGGLQRLGRVGAVLRPLAGDASVRTFYRLSMAAGQTEILMDTGAPFDEALDPFCRTARFLRRRGLPVPALVGVDGESGLVLLEDLGDTMLEGRFPPDRRAAGNRGLESLYEQAVDLAVELQAIDTDRLPEDLPARRLFFDREKLLGELQFFHRHFFGGLLDLTLSSGEESRLQDFYRCLAGQVADLRPRVFCHRDYHSRNLMVRGDGLVMVDFQDARQGPEAYDLVSLLRDCYVDLGPDLEARLLRRYLDRRPAAGEQADFMVGYERTALQRVIKAAGTFAFQAVERGNRRYLAALPLTARHMGSAFDALPEHREAAGVILPRLDDAVQKKAGRR